VGFHIASLTRKDQEWQIQNIRAFHKHTAIHTSLLHKTASGLKHLRCS